VLQQQSVKAALMMANVNGTLDTFLFAQALIQNIDAVENRYHSSWSSELDLMLLFIKLKIYAFQLQAQNQQQKVTSSMRNTSEVDVSGRAFHNLGFLSAVRLIGIFSETLDQSNIVSPVPSNAESENAYVSRRYLPKHFVQGLLFAVSFIFKLMAWHASELSSSDRNLARNHIRLTYRILTSMSLAPGDEPARAARMVHVLSRTHDLSRLKTSEPSTNSGSRLHLLEDTIRVAKEIREGGSQVSESMEDDHSNADLALNLIWTDESVTSNDIPNLPDLYQSQNIFDFGQHFDWNSVPGFDFPVPQYFDFGMENNT
jgi:hypothetical protein